MKNPFVSYFRTSSGYLWLAPVAVYLSVSAGQAMLRNYSSQQETTALRTQLQTAKQERERLTSLVVYYQTDNFKEKELRRAMLLVRPNETVYALPESSMVRSLESETVSDGVVNTTASPNSALPYWRQWLQYLF